MLRLERYIASEIAPNIAIGLLVFTSIFLLDKMFSIANLVIIKGLGTLFVLRILALSVPSLISMTFPMASLLGNLTGFSRLAEDNEITAMLTSGLSYIKIFSGGIITSLTLSVFFVFYNFSVTPVIERKFGEVYSEIMKKNPGIILRENIVHDIKDSKIFIGSIDYGLARLGRVRIFRLKQGNSPSVITARSGTYSLDSAEKLRLSLDDGSVYYADVESPASFTSIDFRKFNMIYNLSTGRISAQQEEKPLSVFTGGELRAAAEKYAGNPGMKTRIMIQYHLRISAAFAIFFLSLLAMPLGLEIRKKARAAAFSISILSIFAYYLALTFFISLAEKNLIPAAPAVWMPNLLFGLFSVFLMARRKMLR